MKKVLVPACILALALLALTGCSKKEETPPPAQQSSAAVSVETATPAQQPEEMSGATESQEEPSTEETKPEETAPQEEVPSVETESQNADFYAVCTGFSKSEVEQFAREVKELILSANWAGLSEHLVYPITVSGVTYEDSAAFAAAPADGLLSAGTAAALESESCVDMFCNYSGIMMGNGEVWINEVLNEDLSSGGLRVTALQL